MTPFLVDTSAWLWALRRRPAQAIKDRLEQLIDARLAATTGMIQLELLGGARNNVELEDLAADLRAVLQLAPRHDSWLRAARLAFGLRRQGVTVPLTDVLIAAIAMENEAVLVHADAHFDRIAQHTELKVESYVRDIG